MSAKSIDLYCRCQATKRRSDFKTGLSWWQGRKKLRCYKRPFHEGLHTYDEIGEF